VLKIIFKNGLNFLTIYNLLYYILQGNLRLLDYISGGHDPLLTVVQTSLFTTTHGVLHQSPSYQPSYLLPLPGGFNWHFNIRFLRQRQ